MSRRNTNIIVWAPFPFRFAKNACFFPEIAPANCRISGPIYLNELPQKIFLMASTANRFGGHFSPPFVTTKLQRWRGKISFAEIRLFFRPENCQGLNFHLKASLLISVSSRELVNNDQQRYGNRFYSPRKYVCQFIFISYISAGKKEFNAS